MKISNNKVVSLSYDLHVDTPEGEKNLVESAGQEHPMVFLFGASGLPEKFEQELEGLSEGDTFTFSLKSHEGYGDKDEAAVVEIPKGVFEIDGKIDEDMLQEGNYIPMADSEGNHLQGMVVSLGDETVKMDFNHPLAGMDMHFNGKVLSIREASAEEIAHGHVHGEGGHHH